MIEETKNERVIAAIDLADCSEGPLLQPLEPPGDTDRRAFAGWETPLAPWGGFRLQSGLAVVLDEGRPVLEWSIVDQDRALIAGTPDLRDYRVTARVKPIAVEARRNVDRDDCREALIGVVFRARTSREYYHFGIEGRRRAVLYRRTDDEWLVLAEHAVEAPEAYVTLDVRLDGDGIRCSCPELGVDFFRTDTHIREGRAGVRGIGQARLDGIRITQTPTEAARDERSRHVRQEEERLRAEEVPEPVLAYTFDHAKLGGAPLFADFAAPGRYDLLVPGEHLRALTPEGRLLWEVPLRVRNVVFSSGREGGGRLVYALTGERAAVERHSVTGKPGRAVIADEMVVLRGTDGALLARAKLPEMDEALQMADFSPGAGNLTGSGGFDVILREWRKDTGNGGIKLWTFDRDLNLLWHRRVSTPYGHHYALAFHDVDGDGRDEVLVGGTLYDGDGNVVWVHDWEDEMARINGAHHYDAVALGNFSEDDSLDPVAFLLGGSAGVYVVEGRTGRTRMVHRVGHAQGRSIGRVRADIPGQQVLVACRWGNMGILTLFSGSGDRLWSIQPDALGQGTCPVTWGSGDAQLLWANTSPAQALYDGYGRRVKALPELSRLWSGRMRKDVETAVARIGAPAVEHLCLTVDGRLFAFRPERQGG